MGNTWDIREVSGGAVSGLAIFNGQVDPYTIKSINGGFVGRGSDGVIYTFRYSSSDLRIVSRRCGINKKKKN